jgi:predicted dehydrogenase
MRNRVLVVGCGSIGQRHIRMLQGTGNGVEVAAVDPLEGKREEVRTRYGLTDVYGTLDEVPPGSIDGVFICSPPKFHVPQALQALAHRVPILIEKPLSNTLAGVEDLAAGAAAAGIPVGVSYNLRYLPQLERAREFLAAGRIGRVLCGRLVCAVNFAAGRPDYSRIYFASRDLGGGVILDHSHELDYLQWLLGDASAVMCMLDQRSDMQIETEDVAMLLIRLADGALIDYHANCFQLNRARGLEIVGTDGTLLTDQVLNALTLVQAGTREEIAFECDGDYSYREQDRNFCAVIRGQGSFRTPLDQGIQTLKLCLAAKQSAASGRLVEMV